MKDSDEATETESPTSDPSPEVDATESPDSEAEADEAEVEADEAEAEAAEVERPKKKKKKSSASERAPSEATAAPARAAVRETAPRSSKESGGVSPLLVAALALAAGGAGGWFARAGQPASQTLAQSDPSVIGSAAPNTGVPGKACEEWKKSLCDGAGADSEGCAQASAAMGLLSEPACAAAKADVPATLARLKSARGTCDTLVTKLCDALGKETETCKMVTEKTPGFPTKQCNDMLANYDKVLGELQQMERQNAPLTAEVAAQQRAGDGPAFGPKDAKVAVVEYSDFECPYCSKAADAVHQLKERYGDKVRFVFRQYPLPFHQSAQLAAEASMAAHAQGKFWEFHDLMFKNQKALDRASLEKYAKEVGLDMAKFKKALDDKTYEEAVKADMTLSKDIGVSGTPTMVVGTKRVSNPTDFASIAAVIDAELAAAGETVPAQQ